jgi:hypothetical protein
MLRRFLLALTCLFVCFALGSEHLFAQQMPSGTEYPEAGPLASNHLTDEFDPWNNFDQPSDFASPRHPYLSHCEGFYAGVELVIVKPYWEDEVDTLQELIIIDDVEFPTLVTLDPDYNCSLSPRIYVGYRNCEGLGTRVRYWYYNESANPLTIHEETEEFGQTTISDSLLKASLNVQALDWEATKRLSDGRFSLEFSGGVRYAKTRVRASFDIRQQVQGPFPFETLASYAGQAAFEGVGPTISAEAYHRLGNSNFSVVGNLRGSLLFGNSNFRADLTTSQSGIPSVERLLANQGKDDLVPIIEAQFGAEYARQVGRGRLAIRALMEGQWWGVSTPGASFSRDLSGVGTVSVDQFNTGRDLGFFGVTTAVIYDY